VTYGYSRYLLPMLFDSEGAIGSGNILSYVIFSTELFLSILILARALGMSCQSAFFPLGRCHFWQNLFSATVFFTLSRALIPAAVLRE
jgi:hypothetical protein